MAARSPTLGSSRLRRLAQRPTHQEEVAAQRDAPEACELCSELIGPEHRHLVDIPNHKLMCACRPCALLFESAQAGDGRYRTVPDRRLYIEDFDLDDARWASLRIPVEMAFFFHSSPVERVMAFYPSPMGATESLLELEAWQDIERANPVVTEIEPDVEALLVNRAMGARGHWVAPIDDCYDLVGLIRSRWKGLSGGQEVWEEIERFFEQLGRRAKVCTRGVVQESNAPVAQATGGG